MNQNFNYLSRGSRPQQIKVPLGLLKVFLENETKVRLSVTDILRKTGTFSDWLSCLARLGLGSKEQL